MREKINSGKIHSLLFTIVFAGAMLSRCSTNDPLITSTYLLDDQWLLTEVTAPDFPFPTDLDTNRISIVFPKTEEYELFLSEKSCSGLYIAKQNGEIEFTRTNCSAECCATDWDYYFLTLLNKSTTFVAKDGESLRLSIDSNNYLIFKFQNRTLTD